MSNFESLPGKAGGLLRLIIKKYSDVKDKCFTLYNGTNTTLFRPYGQKINQKIRQAFNIGSSPLVLYVGRINYDKGVHILVNAMKRVIKQKISNAKLVIVGSSWFKESEKTAYIKKLEQLSIEIKDNIVFTGYLSGSILHYLYSSADIFVCPSLWNEPFGLVLLEAQASGTPVISTARGGIPEIVQNGKTGVIIPVCDDAVLADNIMKLLGDELERQTMGKNGRAVALRNYDWKHVASNLQKYFSMVINDYSR
jgi:spore coat protein SA